MGVLPGCLSPGRLSLNPHDHSSCGHGQGPAGHGRGHRVCKAHQGKGQRSHQGSFPRTEAWFGGGGEPSGLEESTRVFELEWLLPKLIE